MQIQIRKHNLELTTELAQHVERQLHFSLGRFNGRVRSVVVGLQDLNGPKGGVDQECKLSIRTSWSGQVVVAERNPDIFAAVALAAGRAGRAVERQTRLRYGVDRVRPMKIQFGN